MKNRIASLLLVCALLMSLCVSAVARDNPITVQSGGAERFTDVPTSHWAYGYINKVVGSGLFNGKTPATFEPSSAMTRSQFVMVMARMEGRSDLEGVVTQTIFPDVTTTRRAAGPIKWATDEGFVNGFGDGTFKPDSPITRGQFAALIHRYITYKHYVDLNELDPQPDPFTDAASVSTAFTADVEFARVHGLLTGYSDGTVRAGNPITRAAIAAILARFLDLVTESGYTPLLDAPDIGDTDTPPTDAPSSYDGITVKVNNPKNGATPIVRATRDGVLVASDDLQEGDRVTVTHTPNSGYTASMRVRDGNKKVVRVTKTDANTSWFTMPKLTTSPVTVTVTYAKTGSGGGGGGGSSGGGGPTTPTQSYYWNVSAGTSATSANGTVWFTTQDVTPENVATLTPKSERLTNQSKATSTFTFYAVLTPNNADDMVGYTAQNATLVEEANTANPQVFANGVKAYKFKSTNAVSGADNAANVVIIPIFQPAGTADITAAPTLSLNKGWYNNVSEATQAAHPLSDLPELQWTEGKLEGGQTVKFTVPFTDDGYFSYHISDVDIEYTDLEDGVKKPITWRVTDWGEETWAREYSFTVPYGVQPGSEIVVTARYWVEENSALEYNVNVTLTGHGAVSLSAGGLPAVTAQNSDAASKTFTYTGADLGLPANIAEYIEAFSEKAFYPEEFDENWTWEIPLTVSTPTPDVGWSYQTNSLSVSYDKLTNGGTVNVSATFTENTAYGYKMTVIGDGDVEVIFNGDKQPVYGNAESEPSVYSSGLIKDAPSQLTYTVTRTGATWKADSKNPTSPVSLTPANAVKDIVVVFRNTAGVPVKFTVNVEGNGSVDITSENGAIMTKATGDAKSDLKQALVDADISSTATAADGTKGVKGNNNVYYALSGTIVTLTPNPETGSETTKYKVLSIRVLDKTIVDETKQKLDDVSDKAGYSFKLGDPSDPTQVVEKATATVKFGTLTTANAYTVMAEAPVKEGWAAPTNGLYAYSTTIPESATVQQVLNALNNNGQRASDPKITNDFSGTPNNLSVFIQAFLNSKGSDGRTYAEELADSMGDSFTESIDIPKMIEAEKTKALNEVDLKRTVSDSLPNVAAITQPFPVNQATASDVFGAVLRAYFTDQNVADTNPDNYRVVITSLTPKVKGSDDAQSVEAQLLGMLNKYTNDLKVQQAALDGIKPVVSISTKGGASANQTQIIVSAKAYFTSGKPTLTDVKFADYIDSLALYADVTAQVYTATGTAPVYNYSGVRPFSNFDGALAAGGVNRNGTTITNEIKAELTGANGVDRKVADKWAEVFSTGANGKLTRETSGEYTGTNYLVADMSSVLSEDLLSNVIKGAMLEKAIGKVGNQITAVRNYGDGPYTDEKGQSYAVPQTKSAFEDLYDKLVVFNKGSKNILELRTTGDAKKPFGSIDAEGNLALTLDFVSILHDQANQDNTSFEQLVDLLVGIRNGISADIQNGGSGKTPESVIASMIEARIGGRGEMRVNKWGDEYNVKKGSVEAREVSELFAKLVFSAMNDNMETVWADFESKGYRSVAFSARVASSAMDSAKGRLISAMGAAVPSVLSDMEFRAGFKMTQEIQ